MNATFQFAGDAYGLYTNGKIYRNIQYVTVTCGYRKIEGRWDHANQNWSKRCGGPDFDLAVAKAAGFIKEAAPKVRKPREKKVSPVVAQLQLPVDRKAKLVKGKIKIVSVKVAPKVEQKEVKMAKFIPICKRDALATVGAFLMTVDRNHGIITRPMLIKFLATYGCHWAKEAINACLLALGLERIEGDLRCSEGDLQALVNSARKEYPAQINKLTGKVKMAC
jgi:hypothetical protein